MVFLEHEQELRAVERMRLEDVGDDSHGMNDASSSGGGGVKGGDGTAIVESSAAVERSLDTVKAAERLMTSLDIVTEEEARVEMLRKTQEAAAKAGGRSSTMKVCVWQSSACVLGSGWMVKRRTKKKKKGSGPHPATHAFVSFCVDGCFACRFPRTQNCWG